MNKKIILVIILLISFILLITSIVLYVSAQQKIKQSQRIDLLEIDSYTLDELKAYVLNRPTRTPSATYIIPITALLSLFTGLLMYYLLSDELVKKENSIKTKNKTILNLLSSTDKKVIEKIIENEGRIRQYELTYIEGLSKVKVHRIIQNLEDNNIIKKEKLGKVNNIVLDKDIYEMLKN